MLLALLLACDSPTKRGCDACGGDCVEEHLREHGADHVDGDVSYLDPPPASGDHHGCWANWGPHLEEVPPEQFVHNLEHGGIVLLYHCPSGCAEDVAALGAFGASLEENRWLLSPYAETDLSLPFVALAWQERISLGCVDLDRLQRFYDSHVATAPEDVTSAPPASCLEGTGGM